MTTRLTKRDPGWPTRLNEAIHPPPKALHVHGRPLEENDHAIAIVGTRRPTAAGVHAAREISMGLALSGYKIVSGLAVGIDAVAHRAALGAGGRTIAVLGCGHGIDYPKRNRALRRDIEAEGTVVSEYAPDVEPQPFFFPQRNRIIAGLSLATVVIEGTIRSGALVTARLALDANREVFAVPGSVRNVMAQGPNELIRRGEAALVTSAEHVIESLGGMFLVSEAVPGPMPELTPQQEAVLAHLDDVPESIDSFIKATDLSASEVTSALSMLELDRLAKRSMRGYVITDAGAAARAQLPSR